MWVLILEAIAAFFSLVFIVWWTMYCGRPEMKAPAPADDIAAEDTHEAPADKLV